MTCSACHILWSFPNQCIARVQEEPSYKSTKKIEKLTIENVASIHSNLGGRNLGCLGLVSSFAKCLIRSGGINFAAHPNPPTIPPIPDRSTQPQIAAITSRHKEEKRLHREQESIKKISRTKEPKPSKKNALKN